MIETLHFVKGAVSTKDLIPVLLAFHLYDDRIQGTNGNVTIDAPLGVSIKNLTVHAERFLKAVDACDGDPKFTASDDRLIVQRGKFKATIPLENHQSFPRTEQSKLKKCALNLLPALRILKEFIGQDASHPWACGVLLQGDYIYATNNVVLARVEFTWKEGPIVLPSFAVDELLRIGQEPCKLGVTDNALTFGYDNGQWLRALLVKNNWPPSISGMIGKAREKIAPSLRHCIIKVLPFCPDTKFPVIRIEDGMVKTMDGDMTASMLGELFTGKSIFRAEPLLAVLNIATHLDLSKYPKACPFRGPNVEGVILGVNT